MATRASLPDDPGLLILSGATGEYDMRDRERRMIEEKWPQGALRGYSGLTGHSLEAQFPVGMALAALALKSGAKPPRFDPERESDMTTPATSALVTVAGFVHSEGLAALKGE